MARLPGVVNAHTHLEMSVLAGKMSANQEFADWMLELIEVWRQQGERAIIEGIDNAISYLIEVGTSAVGDISSTGYSIPRLLASGLSGVVFFEINGLRMPSAMQRFRIAQRKIDTWRREEGDIRIGLSVHSPYSTGPDVLSAAANWSIAEDVPLALHIAESRAEVEFLRSGSGPFSILQLHPWRAPNLSPVQYLEHLGVMEARPLLFHGVYVDTSDLEVLARSGSTMVHCPRSNAQLGVGRMPLELYMKHNVPVALGTDSLASCPDLNIHNELAFAAALHSRHVSNDSLRELITAAGYHALGLG